MNNCVLTGNLGNDPEVFYNSEGQPVASFNLAFRAGKKKTGWIIRGYDTQSYGGPDKASTSNDKNAISSFTRQL